MFVQRMTIVNYNSLAALYNVRQKFGIYPTQNALGSYSSLF